MRSLVGLRDIWISRSGQQLLRRSPPICSRQVFSRLIHQSPTFSKAKDEAWPATPTKDSKESYPPKREWPPESPQNPKESTRASKWATFTDSLEFPPATPAHLFREGAEVTVHGFLGKCRNKSSTLTFVEIDLRHTPQSALQTLQVVSNAEETDAHASIKEIRAWSPVCVTGTLRSRSKPPPRDSESISVRVTGGYHEPGKPRPPPADLQQQTGPSSAMTSERPMLQSDTFELKLRHIRPLNKFPENIIVSKNATWAPKARHLELRFDPLLRERLEFRSAVTDVLRQHLRKQKFLEVETPLLFKPTPEGAREFLVPARGSRVYALPQSPQQYKQLLMASGVQRYFQFAKCFRDEDQRADRQPEFTQLDLELSFATGEDVKQTIESLMSEVSELLHTNYVPQLLENGAVHPQVREFASHLTGQYQRLELPIHRMSYHTAMRRFGIDKPDLRIEAPIASDIIQVDHMLPQDFTSKITKFDNPIIEAVKFRFGGEVQSSGAFIHNLFDDLPRTVHKLADTGAPGVFVIESKKPLQGLSALGHEAADKFFDLEDPTWGSCEDGDIIIVHARRNIPLHGGSTELGRLRKLIYDNAIQQGLLPPNHDLRFLFIENFPLFTPTDPGAAEPGQGGSAGFSSTHHPFTAPKTAADVELLATDPCRAVADHYDLVLNGMEIGGGSRRIHVAEVQEYIMRDVLKMPDVGVKRFEHLLGALRAGCPPHAGFAFGFDRLISALCDVPSVRDVIAFPKFKGGKDLLVGSPVEMTPQDLADLRQ